MFDASSNIPVFIQTLISVLIVLLLFLLIYYLIYIGNRHVPNNRKIRIRWSNIYKIIGIILIIVVVAWLFRRFPVLGSTLFSFFVSILIAYLLNPLVNKLENYNINRTVGTIIVYAGVVLVFVGLGFLVIPALTTQLTNLIINLPTMAQQVLNWISETLKNFNVSNDQVYKQVEDLVNKTLSEGSTNLLNWSQNFLLTISGSIGRLISLILIPIISFFLLVDKDRIIKKIKHNIPEKNYLETKELYHDINDAMSGFVRGRILMAVFVGIATMIYLLILKVDFAVIIGIITMIGDIIPYVGPAMGFLPAFIFAFIQSPIKAIWVAALFLFIQWVENNILAPKLLGKSTGMHPLVILLSIIIGGGMFGVWGMILSVPFVSLVTILFKFARDKNKSLKADTNNTNIH